MTRQILVVEDDAAIRRAVADALRFSGYAVIQAADGTGGLEAARSRQYDLLLLDLVLPGRDGFEILAEVRRLRPAMPVILLTARGDEADRVRGLRDGADDYVVKPFSVKELLARVEAVLRRSAERPADLAEIAVPGGRIDLSRQEVRFDDGRCHELSQREIELIRYLAINAGRTVSREEILANVWRISPQGIATRTIDMCIARLREKLADDPQRPTILVTVRGRGYKFNRSVSC